ncbi:unnamed protein product [Triticum turgidum subsp. durum]|uniref:Uncharacterized protein n=1 Tax=Triticum turgidum subsp. durum TaxID=4567 RepID=A0A9R0VZB8_TRITD|nr:unnamed protein product [Triticum turgidum subsp. durum]
MARGPCLLLAPWGTLRGSPPTRTASLYIGHNRIHGEEVLEMEEDIQIEEVAPGLVKRQMGTRGGSWWFQAHLFGEQQCATLDSYQGWTEVCPCGRTVSSWSSRSPYQGCLPDSNSLPLSSSRSSSTWTCLSVRYCVSSGGRLFRLAFRLDLRGEGLKQGDEEVHGTLEVFR